ncbi:hypothetical protein RchiOBHm_Chr1g0318001 [Rosa chinensis]|uniref:Uncharacterized protein n=1 Tax=Rosa chinensis TaxID=74649 RepID=A0A2P6S849_ROSCH|nr:uncharacterized protein LOC112183643 [Rosa chinensis]XP_040368972.1 uncharacterized protein LOC112183643 [Rosa chinensis]XP_040368973.1 uncharacterized protein LOC112183643 [Rosa chinensis]PRQ54829.1 hypothetical protein RchiOBHm_Chr1g0318001 [Rosa chinensis]
MIDAGGRDIWFVRVSLARKLRSERDFICLSWCTEAAASGVGIRSDLDPVVSCGGWRGGQARWIVGSDRWVDGLVEGNGAEADLYRIGVGIAGRNHDGGLGVAEPFRIGGSGSLVGGGLEEGGRAGLFTGLDFRSGFGPYWFGSLMGCGILRCWSISGGMALVVRVRPWGNCGGGGCGEVQLLAWTGGSLGFFILSSFQQLHNAIKFFSSVFTSLHFGNTVFMTVVSSLSLTAFISPLIGVRNRSLNP